MTINTLIKRLEAKKAEIGGDKSVYIRGHPGESGTDAYEIVEVDRRRVHIPGQGFVYRDEKCLFIDC
jgi:hypothetical protein